MYKVCLVEDEKDLNDLVVTYLKRDNYDVVSFYDGKDAIDYVGKPVDLWILDIMLKDDINGYDIIKKIKVTISKDEIIFYNDGPQIDSNILNSLFTPYKKGINGNFGLGMSIIKESLWLMSYDITVNNELKGVSFIIKKN